VAKPARAANRTGSGSRNLISMILVVPAAAFAFLVYAYLTLPDVRPLKTSTPATTAFMELRDDEAKAQGKPPRRIQRWASYSRISADLKRAVLVAEDDAFWHHEGVDFEQLQIARDRLGARHLFARRQHHHPAAGQERVPVIGAQLPPQGAGSDAGAVARA